MRMRPTRMDGAHLHCFQVLQELEADKGGKVRPDMLAGHLALN
jgi:hypothetical protein